MTADGRIPAPPTGTKASGRRLWRSVLGRYELEEHELALLREAVRCADLLDDLAAVVAKDGPMLLNSRGDVVAHPAVVEARQARVTLTRLVASLRLPEEAPGDLARGQRRGAARGAYARRFGAA